MDKKSYVQNTENKMFSSPKVYFYSTLILSILCTAIRSAVYFFAYDKEIGYYRGGSPIVWSFYILLVVFIVSIVFAFFTVKSDELGGEFPNVSSLSPETIILMLACMLLTLHSILVFKQDEKTLNIIYIALSIISLAYFFAFSVKDDKSKQNAFVLCGYALIFALAITIFGIYSDRYVPMNNPDKVYLMITISAFMLYFVQEFRFLLGIQKPKAFLAFSLISIFLGSTYSLSHLISFLFGINTLTGEKYLYCDLIFLSLSVYVLFRLAKHLFAEEPCDVSEEPFDVLEVPCDVSEEPCDVPEEPCDVLEEKVESEEAQNFENDMSEGDKNEES